MSRYYNQSQSQLPKRGEPKSHIDAVDLLIKTFESNGWSASRRRKFKIMHYNVDETNKEKPLDVFSFDYRKIEHQWDCFAWHKLDNGITVTAIVEVDGYIHKKKKQIKKDKRAFEIAVFLYRNLDLFSSKQYKRTVGETILGRIKIEDCKTRDDIVQWVKTNIDKEFE